MTCDTSPAAAVPDRPCPGAGASPARSGRNDAVQRLAGRLTGEARREIELTAAARRTAAPAPPPRPRLICATSGSSPSNFTSSRRKPKKETGQTLAVEIAGEIEDEGLEQRAPVLVDGRAAAEAGDAVMERAVGAAQPHRIDAGLQRRFPAAAPCWRSDSRACGRAACRAMTSASTREAIAEQAVRPRRRRPRPAARGCGWTRRLRRPRRERRRPA